MQLQSSYKMEKKEVFIQYNFFILIIWQNWAVLNALGLILNTAIDPVSIILFVVFFFLQ